MKNLPLIAIAPVALTIVACEPREVPATLEARYRQEDLVRFHSVYRDLCRIGRARACTAEHMIRETLREGGVCYGPAQWGEKNTFHTCNATDRAMDEQRQNQYEIAMNARAENEGDLR
jgi:hypothetical protein